MGACLVLSASIVVSQAHIYIYIYMIRGCVNPPTPYHGLCNGTDSHPQMAPPTRVPLRPHDHGMMVVVVAAPGQRSCVSVDPFVRRVRSGSSVGGGYGEPSCLCGWGLERGPLFGMCDTYTYIYIAVTYVEVSD